MNSIGMRPRFPSSPTSLSEADRATGQFLSGRSFAKTNWYSDFDEKGRPMRAEGILPTDKGSWFTRVTKARRIGTTPHSVLRQACFTSRHGRTAPAFTAKARSLPKSMTARVSPDYGPHDKGQPATTCSARSSDGIQESATVSGPLDCQLRRRKAEF